MPVQNTPKPRRLNHTKPKFKVGDKIKFEFVFGYLMGHIEEYRGPLVRGGVNLYRVVSDDTKIPRVLELPETEIEFQ